MVEIDTPKNNEGNQMEPVKSELSEKQNDRYRFNYKGTVLLPPQFSPHAKVE